MEGVNFKRDLKGRENKDTKEDQTGEYTDF
jgi:hypothetical protein